MPLSIPGALNTDPDTLTAMDRHKTMAMKLLVEVVNDYLKYVTKVSKKLF